jgi:hypothetical protein
VSPDTINSTFELVAGCLIWLSVRKLARDKKVLGVHFAPISFFALWGFWNLYYYPAIDQWWSFFAGINVVTANTVWMVQMIYYEWRERVAITNPSEIGRKLAEARISSQ